MSDSNVSALEEKRQKLAARIHKASSTYNLEKDLVADLLGSINMCRLQGEKLDALMDASKAVLSHKGFKHSARAIFDLCKDLIGATSGYVALLSDTGEENEVLFLEAGGLACTVDPELPMPIRGLRAQAYEKNQAVYHNDFMNSEWIEFMPKGHVILKNVMFAPLILDGKTVGIMGLANKEEDFTDSDAKIATSFGELAAISLQNNRNLDQLKETKEALVEKNQELNNTLDQLKAAQTQMLQSEKMVTIGHLAAGVAHEINNPISFLLPNLDMLTDYFDRINELMGRYGELISRPSLEGLGNIPKDFEKKVKVIKEFEDLSDMQNIKEDLPFLLDDCKEASQRISRIVKTLKNFAQPGNERMLLVNVNELLEAVLEVLHNELKSKATIEKKFQDIELIKGSAAKLNLCFMNLLLNAVQAIDENGHIIVETRQDEKTVTVVIADNGCGMPADILPKIFDPFFTTKPVGIGTGMGLSMSYQIVQEHGGSIEVESTENSDTQFSIVFPRHVPE